MTEHRQPNDTSKIDRENRARELLSDFFRNGNVGSHEALLKEHPELRNELEVEVHKLNLIHGAMQRVAQPGSLNQIAADSIYCPSCHVSVEEELDSRSGAETTTCKSCGETFAILPRPDAIGVVAGQRFDRFELIERIGAGGFGTVWRAADPNLDRNVALKLPRSGRGTKEDAAAFLREARTAAQLKHPNIVRVHDVGQFGETTFIVSDLIEGISLAERLAIRACSAQESAKMGVKLARAMQYAHDAGVVHRDLKPQNILIDEKAEPFVTDFGLARRDAIDITVTTDGAILGTPAFMAPEQARGQSHSADSKTDVYAMGAMMFQMLTGELPFRGGAADVLRQVIEEPPARLRRLNSRIPVDLETICLKCLEKNPEQRYATMAALADDLQRWLDRKPIVARPVGAVGKASRWCQRKPALAAAIALLVLTVAAGFSGVFWQWQKTETALARADKNKQKSWELIEEFLYDLSEIDLRDQPGMGEVRARLLRRAEEHLQQIAQDNEGDVASDLAVARAQTALGNLMSGQGDRGAALVLLSDALDSMFEIESRENSTTVRKQIIEGLIARGQLVSMAPEISPEADSVEDFSHALRRLDDLLAGDRQSADSLRLRADLLAKLGWQYRQSGDAATIPTLLEAIGACQLLPDPNSSFSLAMQGKCHTDLAEFYIARGEVSDGIDQAHAAIEVVNEGLKSAPEDVDLRGTFCAASHSLGVALLNSGRPDESIPVFGDAIDVRRTLSREFPKRKYFRAHMALLTYYLATAHSNVGNNNDALELLRRVVEMRRALATEFPDDLANRSDIAGAIVSIADLQVTSGSYEPALASISEALELFDELPESLANSVNRSLAMASKSTVLIELGAFGEAVEVAENAKRFADEFIKHDPSSAQLTGLRVSVLADLISALQQHENHDRASEVIEEELAAATAVLESEASDSRSQGQAFFAAAGAARLAAGEPTDAIRYFELALRGEMNSDPDREDWIQKLIESYEQAGRDEDAQRWRQTLDADSPESHGRF